MENEHKEQVKKNPVGRPRLDPNRKRYCFYCTAEEILYLRSLLKKMRTVLKLTVDSQQEQGK
ncbi:MAG: hypothetical protein IKN12_02340 [Selenomonadaceae bacterium]|nr:hypothetical protein [Selenomonadaceae bacterium]